MLKDLQRQALNQTEQDLLRITHAQPFTIPEPLHTYFKQYGAVVPPTSSHLYPEFPSLPTEVVRGFGGYYGPLNNNTHNLYEEVPCLGVMAEAVRQAVGNAPAGAYNSSLSTNELVVNNNLLGYAPLGFRQNEAKNNANLHGITNQNFRESIRNTGFNLDFITWISGYLATLTTFKNSSVTIMAMGVGGRGFKGRTIYKWNISVNIGQISTKSDM